MHKKPYGSAAVIGCMPPALAAARSLVAWFQRVTLIDQAGCTDQQISSCSALLDDLRTHPQVRFRQARGGVAILLDPSRTYVIGVTLGATGDADTSAVIADLIVDTRDMAVGSKAFDHYVCVSEALEPSAVAAALLAGLTEQQRAHRNGSLEGVAKRLSPFLYPV